MSVSWVWKGPHTSLYGISKKHYPSSSTSFTAEELTLQPSKNLLFKQTLKMILLLFAYCPNRQLQHFLKKLINIYATHNSSLFYMDKLWIEANLLLLPMRIPAEVGHKIILWTPTNFRPKLSPLFFNIPWTWIVLRITKTKI